MRPLVLLFLLAICARSQDTTHTVFRIYAQPIYVGSLTQYVASVCNTGSASLNVQAAQVWAAAYASGVAPATHENVLQEGARVVRMSWQRKALLFIEGATYVSAWAITTDAVGKIDINTPQGKAVAVGLPAFGVLLRVTTTAVEQSKPTFTMPETNRLLPNFFMLAAGQCSDYLVYGTPIR